MDDGEDDDEEDEDDEDDDEDDDDEDHDDENDDEGRLNGGVEINNKSGAALKGKGEGGRSKGCMG